MSDMQINQVLQQMRAMAAAAESRSSEPSGAQGETVDFAQLLKDSLDTVNQAQGKATGLAQSFELGEQGVDIADVMVAAQKASLSFEAMKQVRNKLLNAYQEVMNMPV